MRILLWIVVVCLFNLTLIRTDDDDIDEDISIEDSPTIQSSASSNVEKENVPTMRSTSPNLFFEEQFQDKSKWTRWVKSQAKKDGVDESLAKYDGEWGLEIPQSSVYNDDYALILKVNDSISISF